MENNENKVLQLDNVNNNENNEKMEEVKMNEVSVNNTNEKTENISIDRFVKGATNILNLKMDEKKKTEMLNDYINQHIVDKYISYGDKVDIISRIIKSSCYVKAGSGDDAITIFKQNSPAKHMLYCLSMIDCYTDIDITFANSIEEYDKLTEYGLSMMIMNRIPENESTEFAMLMSMQMEDVYENERSAVGMVENIKIGVGKVIGGIIDSFLEVIENNPEGVEELLGKIVEK